MRAFWAVLAALAVAGLWFVLVPAQPAGSGRAMVKAADTEARESEARESEARESATEPTATATRTRAGASGIADLATNAPSATGPTATDAVPKPDIDLLGEDGAPVIPLSLSQRPLKADARAPSDVVRRIDDRTLELDGRFRVRGNGSAADPYAISWELLTSASEYIDPARGARTPPPWVRLVDGTTVEISGYYSTAVRVAVAKNLLLTLNRWDGCCIGVPPTPFDAIDITMRDALPVRGLHLVRFGTFRGVLRVEPIDAGGFLLGLYRLEDATFETK